MHTDETGRNCLSTPSEISGSFLIENLIHYNMSYISEYNRYKLEELKKLKGFFESCVKESDKAKNVAGHFGAGYSVFFGNAIQYNSFDIPYEAMRLIYEANKERIENELKFATVT